MAHIVSLRILHEYLQDDCLWFEADGDEEMSGGDIIPYELDIPGPAPGIAIDRGTGSVHSIVLEQASTELGTALAFQPPGTGHHRQYARGGAPDSREASGW